MPPVKMSLRCKVQSELEVELVHLGDAGHQQSHHADRDPDRRGADPRARAGHGRASLVMPVVPAEIMLSKIFANGLVILVAAGVVAAVCRAMVAASADRRVDFAVSGGRVRFMFSRSRRLAFCSARIASTMGQFGLLCNSGPAGHDAAVRQHARRWRACRSGCNM